MKKILSTLIIITLVAASFIGFSGTALAANDSLDVSTTTTELLEGTTVDFAATITAGDANLASYKITYNGSPVWDSGGASLVAGDVKNVSFSMEVTTAMLGNPMHFVLAADSGTDLASDNVTIAKKEPTIKLASSVKVSNKLAPEGGTVKFTFSLENQGDVRLEDITVTAPELNSGKPLRDAFGLDPKQSYDVVYSYTMPGKDIVINPVVNYKYKGTAQEKIVLETVSLTLEERHVVPTLTVDNKNPNAGEDVTFTLKIVNEGNVPYSNMTVLMNGEEVDFPARYLNPGDDYSEDYTMSFQISTDVVFKISLKDHTGNTVSVNSNTISIQLPVDPDAIKDKLTFNISVDRPALTSESTVNFTGNITNSTDYTLTDISVDEPTLGNVYLADELAAASSKKIEFPADINETTTFEFVVTVTDRDGKTYTINAEPITVTVTSVAIEDDEEEFDDAAEVDNPGQELTIDSGGMGTLGVFGIILIVLIVLIIGVGVALLVIWRKGVSTPSRTPGPSKGKGNGRKPSVKKKVFKKPTKSYKDRNNF